MKIKHESDAFPSARDLNLCRRFEVEFTLVASSDADCMAEDISVWDIDAGDVRVELESLPLEDQREIESRLQAIADEQCYEIWMEQQRGAAERWADSMEDR